VGEDPLRPGGFLRVAGRAVLPGGTLTWSIAEGRRGRRIRSTLHDGNGLGLVVLLEVASDGRHTRLECATGSGLLTLHPEPDERSAHGNVVGHAGVRPLVLGWSPSHWLEIPGVPVVAATIFQGLASRVAVGGMIQVPLLVAGTDLGVTEAGATIHRLSGERWELRRTDGSVVELELERDGVPRFEGFALEVGTWPLDASGSRA